MTENEPSKANPALKDLQVFIGRWEMELSNTAFLPDPSVTMKGEVSFDWLENEAFVIMHMGGDPSSSQGAIWLIGRDEASPDYKVFYYDDRKVSRIYEMSFSDRVWKLWRQAPSFSQRFEGKISDHGNKILGKWENSNDGQKWEHDFDVTYTRIK